MVKTTPAQRNVVFRLATASTPGSIIHRPGPNHRMPPALKLFAGAGSAASAAVTAAVLSVEPSGVPATTVQPSVRATAAEFTVGAAAVPPRSPARRISPAVVLVA